MITTLRIEDELLEEFDRTVRQIAARENRPLDRTARLKELIKKDIAFNKNKQ